MPTNTYFNSNYNSTSEQDLHESLIIEAIKRYGIDIKYIPRTLVNEDKLFGEDQSSAFNEAYDIEVYVKSNSQFGGDGNFLSKFGLEIRDEVMLTIAKRRFQEDITSQDEELVRPREGDLLQLPTTVDQKSRLFEISYVNFEEIFYQLGKLHTYEITAKVFEMGGESFDTEDESIDGMLDYRVTTQYLMSNGSGNYQVGEAISTATGITAIVSEWNTQRKILSVHTTSGDLSVGEAITGQISNAVWTVVSEIGIDVKNGIEDNNTIDNEGNSVIDFSESNPFSE